MSRLLEIHDLRGSRLLSDRDLPLRIGAGEQSDILLPSGRETEAYIGIGRGHLFLQPAPGSSTLLHNDELVTASVWIKSGDVTRVGDHFLHHAIAGDRVEIRLSAMALKPPATPVQDSASERPLPRVAADTARHPARSRLLGGAAALLLLLLLAAWFVLSSRALEITIQPEPDSVSVAGFPPVIKFGRQYLGLRGSYTAKAVRDGYEDLEAEVVISDRTTNTYTFAMTRLPGRIDLAAGPVEGAEVFIDGTAAGRTPLRRLRLAAGEHEIRIRKDRYLDFATTITVEGLNREQRFDFPLTPSWSEVVLRTEPTGATVLVGGEERGVTPLELELPAGTCQITYRKTAFSEATMELTVPAGERLVPPPIVLQPAPAVLSLVSTPAGAAVTVDGVFQGTAPLELRLSPDKEHTLTLAKQGHSSLVQGVRLAPAETRSLSLSLTPESGTLFLTTDPPDAELYIDGRLHGPATGRLELEAHKHTLEIRAKGYTTVTREITPAAGYSRRLDIRLDPAEKAIAPAAGGQANVRTGEDRRLVRMEPATFEMGASRRDPGSRANERLRRVQITRSFSIGVREVTNGEFRRFKPDHSSGAVGGFSLDQDNQPVVNVSWEDAASYLNWLSSREGLAPFYVDRNGTMVPSEPMTEGYRLPLEAEWAFAARQAGRKTSARYPWSGTFPPPAGSGNFADESAGGLLPVVLRGYNDSFPVTAPVASFPTDPGGLFDTGGNVSEWCHDYYSPYAGLSDRTEVDPTGPAEGTHHVVRGSSWRDASITELRLSYRTYSDRGRDYIGFRIARFAR